MPSNSPAKGRSLRLGDFDLFAPVSAWGEGVYKAEDAKLGRKALVKILPPDLAANSAACESHRRVAMKAAAMHHENLLAIYELGDSFGTWFLAFEPVDGVTLAEHVQMQGALTPEHSVRLVQQAARAMQTAQAHGFELPDVTPSGMLVTFKNEQPQLKLIPLRLLRDSRAEKSTEEYMAPEILRDRSKADVRSSIYTLGATLHFMLAGRTPKTPDSVPWSVGSRLTEALLKKMLAKDPEGRYQTLAELLEELDTAPATASAQQQDVRGGFQLVPDKAIDAPRPGPSALPSPLGGEGPGITTASKVKPAIATERARPAASQENTSKPAEPSPWPDWIRKPHAIAGIMGSVIVLLGIVIFFLATRGPSVRPGADGDPLAKKDPKKNPEPPPEIDPEGVPVLYRPSAPLDVPKLQKEFLGPFAKPANIPEKADFRVCRVPLAKADAVDFESLAAACAAALEGKTTVIEIHDNGPLFEAPIAVQNRSLVIRAGAGYRPLVVLDWERSKLHARKELTALLSVTKGNLMLAGLDVAMEWPEKAAAPAALVSVTDGDFLAGPATFSVAGKHAEGVTLIRFDGSSGNLCGLSNCVARGENLIALDIQAPGSEVMVNHCLIVGGDQPLIRCQGQGKASTFRMIRSTLVAQKNILALADAKPSLSWLGWDLLLAREGSKAGGVMVDLPAGGVTENMRWKAVNCLYAGWEKLLSAKESIAGDDNTAWRRRWQLSEGDKAVSTASSVYGDQDLAEMDAARFTTDQTALAYTATFSPGLLGCDLAKIPAPKTQWLALTYRRFAIPELEVLRDSKPPEIPKADEKDKKDKKYHGGKLDLDTTDLGAFLKKTQEKQGLAPYVVLHLTGSGPRKTSPIAVKDVNLVLYFEPPAAGKDPLFLLVDTEAPTRQTAAIQIEEGNLQIIGGDIRLPNVKSENMPRYLIHMNAGNLRIHGARLQGPLEDAPPSYWGLIRFEGSGINDRRQVFGCTIHESILRTASIGLHVVGTSARLRLEKNLIISGGDALHFQPGQHAGTVLNDQCTLENNTIAARQSVVYVEEAPAGTALEEPIIIQSKSNVYLSPFLIGEKEPARATMMLYQGLAAPQCVLAWQSEGDVFDGRLFGYGIGAGADGRIPKTAAKQTFAAWERLWGPLGSRRAVLDVPFTATIDLDTPQFQVLAVPDHPGLKGLTPGADLGRLGIGKKK